MYQSRYDIARFLTVVLTAGLILSTFHIHGGVTSPSGNTSDTGLEIVQDHNFCPVCAVVFESTDIICDEMPGPDFTFEILPLHDDSNAIQNFYAAKKGRSPPALHI